MLINKIRETFDINGRMLTMAVYAAYMELSQNQMDAGYTSIAKAIGYDKYVVRDILDWLKKQEKAIAQVPDDLSYNDGLAKEIEEAFLNESRAIYKWSRERKALNEIIRRVSLIDKDNVSKGVMLMVKTFYDLCNSGDKFWNSKPFLPSELVKDYAWQRVYTVAKKAIVQTIESPDDEELQEVFGG